MNDPLLSPPVPKFGRSDSLVFSITAQKDESCQDSDLLQDSAEEASKQIFNMTNKLYDLENQVMAIKTQQVDQLEIYQKRENIDISNLTLGEDECQPGRFRKKSTQKLNEIYLNKTMLHSEQPVGKLTSTSSSSITKRANFIKTQDYRPKSTQNRRSVSKNKDELAARQMKIELKKMRIKIERTERSKSKCSERLSQTKQNIKVLQSQKQNTDKIMNSLASDLKKSENIRKRQKQTILKQKKEIQQLKQLVNSLKSGTGIKIL